MHLTWQNHYPHYHQNSHMDLCLCSGIDIGFEITKHCSIHSRSEPCRPHTLHGTHTVSNVHHILFYTSNLWTALTFYVCSTLPDIWDVTSLFKVSNGKRQNLAIIQLCHTIFIWSKLKILLHLQGKLCFCIILRRPPRSMNSYLVKPFQIRIKP